MSTQSRPLDMARPLDLAKIDLDARIMRAHYTRQSVKQLGLWLRNRLSLSTRQPQNA